MNGSGIYQIRNETNEKLYVGSAVNLRQRWAQHRSAWRHGNHDNPYLQNAWNLYGGEVFAFSVLEYVADPEGLLEREQHYLDTLQPEYNIAPRAGNCLGIKRTCEYKRNMSEAKMGCVASAEARRKMSEAQMGMVRGPFSEEHRRRIGEAHRGKVLSEGHRQKLREARTGKVHSAESKAKIGEAQRGENGNNAKLTEQAVLEIRTLLKEGVLSQQQIADRYGVCQKTISNIKLGRTWAHLID